MRAFTLGKYTHARRDPISLFIEQCTGVCPPDHRALNSVATRFTIRAISIRDGSSFHPHLVCADDPRRFGRAGTSAKIIVHLLLSRVPVTVAGRSS